MHDDPTSDVTFYPPLYVQRYAAVRDILLRVGAIGVGSGSVVDVGCSEGGFAQFVMSPTSTLGPQHMTLIDMSTNALTEVRRKVLSDTIGAMHWFPRTADLVLGDATLSDTQFSEATVLTTRWWPLRQSSTWPFETPPLSCTICLGT
jgi:hypothetical protein